MKPCKPKPCRNCKVSFVPYHSLKVCCSIPCEIAYATMRQGQLEKRRQKAAQAASNRTHRERKEALKTRKDYLPLAQDNFNKFIRFRDYNEPCISCGRFDSEIAEKPTGGKWDAGHFRTRGAAPELRFTELNAWKQCKSCNGGAGKYTRKNSTVSKDYRENLIKKIGLEKVEWLEGPHPPLKLTIDEIKAIKVKYAKLARDLEKKYASLD